MKKVKTGKMVYVLQVISFVPLLFFGLVILFLSMTLFTNAMYSEVEEEIEGVAKNTAFLFESTYPGDYKLVADAPSLYLYKGEEDLTTRFDIVDTLKENSGYDVALFFRDTCVLTTLENADGQRLIGIGASKIVVSDVLEAGQERFYPNTKVDEKKFFCYYTPLRNSDGSVVGMLLIAKPSNRINNAIRKASYPLFGAVMGIALLICTFIHLYTRKFDLVLQKIRLFLSNISTGDLNAELDNVVLKRRDEFGDIGRSAVQMQQALRVTIEQDALTELFNRRSGDRRLRQIIQKSSVKQTPFCVCIGDIDFFKKVNDTYGHDCGDLVLKSVAAILGEHMASAGFVARWGGEEFLLVFDRMELKDATRSLERLLKKIREAEIVYHDQTIRVTMTFGVTEGNSSDPDVLLKVADHKLYEGKTSGRNRIIS